MQTNEAQKVAFLSPAVATNDLFMTQCCRKRMGDVRSTDSPYEQWSMTKSRKIVEYEALSEG